MTQLRPQRQLLARSTVPWTTSLDIPHLQDDDSWGIATANWTLSDDCRQALAELLQSPAPLAVATEASSHPSGLLALQAQPWVYAGGGLGNEGECLGLPGMQTCLAGAATSRAATLSFARLCWPAACTAHDLVSVDLVPTLMTTEESYGRQIWTMLRINRFLQTGWTCGYYQVPWM